MLPPAASLPAGLMIAVCHEAGRAAAAHDATHHQQGLAWFAGGQSLDLEFACCDLGVDLGGSQRSGEGVQCHGSVSVELREFYRVRGQGSTPPPIVGVHGCPLPCGQTVNPRGSERATSVPLAVGVQLGATLHHIGHDPHGLAGLEIGSDVVQCHRCVV